MLWPVRTYPSSQAKVTVFGYVYSVDSCNTFNIFMNIQSWPTFITTRKQSCGKVMFLYPSVILFTGSVPLGLGGVHPVVTPPPWTHTSSWTHTPGHIHPLETHTLWTHTPLPGHTFLQSTSRQYASYWNAFLFLYICSFLHYLDAWMLVNVKTDVRWPFKVTDFIGLFNFGWHSQNKVGNIDIVGKS